MVVCPVCENQQPTGDECQVCGHRLRGPGVAPLPVEPLPGLEATALGSAEPPPAAPMLELEPTRHRPAAGDAPLVPELEPTRAAPVQVRPETVPGLEPTEAEALPGDAPTLRPATLTCRYCRTENPPSEVICGRCGMRLSRWEGPAAPGSLEALAPTRCPACGTLNAGEICTGCGGLVRRG